MSAPPVPAEVRTATLSGEGIVRRGLLGVDPVLAMVWAIAAVTAAMCFLFVGGFIGAGLGVVVGATVAGTTVSFGDEPPYALRKVNRLRDRRRRTRGEHLYCSALDRGELTGTVSPSYDPNTDPAWEHPVFCGRMEPLPLSGTGFDQLFILRHANPGDRHGYLSVTLSVEGVRGGLRSNPAYAAVWRQWGWVQAELAKRSSFIRGIELLHRSVPADITPHIQWYRERAHYDDPKLAPLLANYDDLIEEIRPLAEEHRVFVTVKIPLTPALFAEAATRDEFNGSRRAEVGWASVVKDELERLVRLLSGAGWGRVQVLGERRTAAVVRSLMNPDYALDDDRGVDWNSCWQTYVGGKSSVLVAGKWHTRCAEIPPGAVEGDFLGPLWLQPLLVGVEADEGRADLPRASTIRTVAVRIDFIPDSKARAEAVKDSAQDESTRIRNKKRGKISDGTAEVMQNASQRRRGDLKPGSNIHGTAYSIFVAVTGRDPEDLRRACLRVEHAAGSAGINRLVWHDDFHDVAQVQTLPLCRGMTGVKAASTN